MKGLTLTSALLASLLAFSGIAIAEEQSGEIAPDSGVESAQDVDPGDTQGNINPTEEDEVAPNSGVDSAQDVDPQDTQGDLNPTEKEELDPNSGVDSSQDVDPEGDDM